MFGTAAQGSNLRIRAFGRNSGRQHVPTYSRHLLQRSTRLAGQIRKPHGAFLCVLHQIPVLYPYQLIRRARPLGQTISIRGAAGPLGGPESHGPPHLGINCEHVTVHRRRSCLKCRDRKLSPGAARRRRASADSGAHARRPHRELTTWRTDGVAPLPLADQSLSGSSWTCALVHGAKLRRRAGGTSDCRQPGSSHLVCRTAWCLIHADATQTASWRPFRLTGRYATPDAQADAARPRRDAAGISTNRAADRVRQRIAHTVSDPPGPLRASVASQLTTYGYRTGLGCNGPTCQ